MKRINTVMAMMRTKNKSDAVRFIIEAAWSVYGPLIEGKVRKNENIQIESLYDETPTYYYRTNFDKSWGELTKK